MNKVDDNDLSLSDDEYDDGEIDIHSSNRDFATDQEADSRDKNKV